MRKTIRNRKFLIVLFVIAMATAIALIPYITYANQNSENVARVNGNEYATLWEAVNAAGENQTVEIIKAYDEGNPDAYKLPGSHNTKITITKDASLPVSEAVIFCDFEGNICMFEDTTTFKSVCINLGSHSYHGFQTSPNIIFENCIINGLLFGYGDCTFNTCEFNQTACEYNMWTYAGNHTYNNCTFNGYGKYINVYNSGMGQTFTHKFNTCKFVNFDDEANKSAINVKANCIVGDGLYKKLMWDVQITNCQTEGLFPRNKRLEDPIVMIDDYNSEYVTITKDGKVIYPEPPKVINAPIGKTTTLNTALADGSEPVQWESTNPNIIQILETSNDESSKNVKRIAAGSACVIASVASVKDMKSYFYFGAPEVKFNMNGHGSQIESQVLNPDDNPQMHPEKPEDPVASGWEFEGWYSDPGLTNEFNFNEQVFGDVIVYAKWKNVGPEPPTPPEPTPDPGGDPEAQNVNASIATGDNMPIIAIISMLVLLLLLATTTKLIKSNSLNEQSLHVRH